MINVTFLPWNKTLTLSPGTNILIAANEQGIDIPSLCQSGTCTTCVCLVKKGAEFLTEEFSDPQKSVTTSIFTCITMIKKDISTGEVIISYEGE